MECGLERIWVLSYMVWTWEKEGVGMYRGDDEDEVAAAAASVLAGA